MEHQVLKNILTILDQHHSSTLYDLLVQTLRSSDPVHERHRQSLLAQIPDVLDLLSERSGGLLETSAIRVAAATYQSEVQELIAPNTGFHFKGTGACLAQLESFSIARMGITIQKIAPNLWNLLGILLDANPSRRRAAPDGPDGVDEDVEMELADIATAIWGNDEGSDESGDEDDERYDNQEDTEHIVEEEMDNSRDGGEGPEDDMHNANSQSPVLDTKTQPDDSDMDVNQSASYNHADTP
jgi:hypothetical protein